jgi:hypothetical protein
MSPIQATVSPDKRRHALKSSHARGIVAARAAVTLPPPPHFLLGRTATGLWAIRDDAARKAGLFCSRAAALRFAQTESRDVNVAVTFLPEGLELDLAAAA